MEKNSWKERVRRVEKRRWLICLPLALAFIIVHFHRFAMGVVSDSIMRDFGLTRAAELGLLSSIYFYTYAILQIPTGISADYWGPRRTITAALAVAAAGTLVFGWAPSLTWVYVGRFLASAGVAFIYINIVKFYAAWFRSREFGTMSGMSSLIGNFGFALATTPLAMMVENVGWRESFYVVAFLTLLVAAYCWLAVRNSPAVYGWPTAEEIEAAEGDGLAVSKNGKSSIIESLRTVIANRHTWPPFIASTACYSVFVTFAGVWGVPYLMQVHGMPRVEAAGYMVAISAGYMTAGPLAGYLSDRFSTRRWPYVAQMTVMLAVWLVLTAWDGGKPPAAVLYPLFVALGAGASGVTLTLACAKEVNPPHMTGIATGLVNMGPFFGAAVVQPLFGLVLDLKWQGAIEQGVKIYPAEAYQTAFGLLTVLIVVAVAATFCIKETCGVNIAHRINGGSDL